MNRNEAIERVLALQSKHDDPATTDAEKIAVSRRMLRLMDEHDLSGEDLEDTQLPEYLRGTTKKKALVGDEPPSFLKKYADKVYDNFGPKDAAKAKKNG